MKSSKVSPPRPTPQLVPLHSSDTDISVYRARCQHVVHPSEKRCEERKGEESGVTGRQAGGQAFVGDMLEEQGRGIPSEDVQTHRTGPGQKHETAQLHPGAPIHTSLGPGVSQQNIKFLPASQIHGGASAHICYHSAT